MLKKKLTVFCVNLSNGRNGMSDVIWYALIKGADTFRSVLAKYRKRDCGIWKNYKNSSRKKNKNGESLLIIIET